MPTAPHDHRPASPSPAGQGGPTLRLAGPSGAPPTNGGPSLRLSTNPTGGPSGAAANLAEQPANPAAHAVNDTLRRNLEAMARRSPRAARRIAGAAPREGLAFADTDEGPTAVLDGVRLASARKPITEAQSLAERIDLDETGCVVWLGFGLGHHVRALAQRADRACVQIVFEPDVPLLRAVLERVDLSGVFATGDVIVLTDPDAAGEASACVNGSEGMLAIGVDIVDHPPSRSRIAPYAAAFTGCLAGIVDAVRTSVVTTLVQTDTTVRNLLMNAGPYLECGGIAPLKNAAAGVAAVIVSAGPSLARNIDDLRGYGVGSPREHELIVIATQTTLKPLLAHGIKPHFVTALDYHEISTRFYEGLTAGDVRGVTLVAEPKANPAIIDAFPGRVLLSEDESLNELLGRDVSLARPGGGPDSAIPPGGTVAHLAYALARHLGCDPAILIGQDLGFTDGQYYGDGAAIHDVWAAELSEFTSLESMEWRRIARMRGHLKQAKDHLGRPVYTDAQMATYLDQFERAFLEDEERGLVTIDATEGGLAKRSTRTMTLAAALADANDAQGRAALPPLETDAYACGASASKAGLEAARRNLVDLRRDVGQVERLSRQTAALLAKLEAVAGDTARTNAIVKDVHRNRDRVQKLTRAFALVQRLNQAGVFKRYKLDRAMRLRPGETERDRHLLRVERDRMNVKWLADVAVVAGELIGGAIDALDGKPKRTRDPVLDDKGELVRTKRSGVHACAFVLARAADAERTVGGASPLRRTIDRLAAARGVRSVVVLVDDETERDAVRAAVRAWAGDVRVPVSVADDLRSDEQRAIARAWRRRIDRGRAFAPRAWRSGALPSLYDEALEPEWTLALLSQDTRIEAAVVAAGSWGCVDTGLTAELLDRYAQSPSGHALTFCQASAGLAPAVFAVPVLEDLAATRAQGGSFGTTAGALGYIPVKPRTDPISKPACVGVPPELRDAGLRFALDGGTDHAALATIITGATGGANDIEASARRGHQLLCAPKEAATLPGPSEVVFDVGGGTATRSVRAAWHGFAGGETFGRLRVDTIGHTLSALADAGAQVGVVTLRGFGGVDGTGDPALHDDLAAMIGTARAHGATTVHVRTDMSVGRTLSHSDGLLDALADADIVSVDLLAQTPGVYAAITGRSDLLAARSSCEALWSRWQGERVSNGPNAVPERWLIPRITRCDAVYEEIEAFHDGWLMTVGSSAIDPLPRAMPGERIAPLTLPRLARASWATRAITVNSAGEVFANASRPDESIIGKVGSRPIEELWRALVCARLGEVRS